MRTFTFRRIDVTSGDIHLDSLIESYLPMKNPEEVINLKQ